MSKTVVACGRAVAIFTDDGLGRRLAVGTAIHGVVRDPVIIATTKAEAIEAISALRQLVDELPGDLARAVSVRGGA